MDALTHRHELQPRCRAVACARFLRRVPWGGRILRIAEGAAPNPLEAFDSRYRADVRGLWDDLGDALGQYNGVWLADGLVRCGASRLSYALARATGCLRPGGVLYVAFLRGPEAHEAGAGVANPRAMTREALQGLVARLPGVSLAETWMTPAPVRRLFGAGPAWLHALCTVDAAATAHQPTRIWQLAGWAPPPAYAARACA